MTLEKQIIPNIKLRSEMPAVEVHKYFMAIEQKKPVSFQDAIKDWNSKYQGDWLKEKTRIDNLKQKEEIDKHKYLRSKQEGRDLGPQAVEEWMQKYAPMWREARESLMQNGLLERKLTIQNILGLHVRPSVTLVGIAKKYDCDIYAHKEGMEDCDFTINKRPYIDVCFCSDSESPAMKLVELCAGKGDELEFIAYGKQAKEALDEIEDITSKKFGEEQ
jgi:phosphotransferase system HPr-like phosphotransfer protein